MSYSIIFMKNNKSEEITVAEELPPDTSPYAMKREIVHRYPLAMVNQKQPSPLTGEEKTDAILRNAGIEPSSVEVKINNE